MNMAPQFWRFLPALCLAAAVPFALLGDLLDDRIGRLPGFDWTVLRIVTIGALLSAGFAFYQAPRLDRLSAALTSTAGLGGAWCAFLLPGEYGAEAAFVGYCAAGLWGFAALLIAGTAYHRLRWLRWLTLPILTLAVLGCALWLGYAVYVAAPSLIERLTPTRE